MQDISEDIIKKASAGDLKSFETLYQATAGFVYNVAWRIVNNKEDAEEVTQEVYIIMHRKLKSFRFESSLRTWIYRITTNQAINLAKKGSRMRNKTIEYDEASMGTAVPHGSGRRNSVSSSVPAGTSSSSNARRLRPRRSGRSSSAASSRRWTVTSTTKCSSSPAARAS